MNRSYYLKQFLNQYWLRPENAILLTLRAESYYQAVKSITNDSDKCMDVSCGDGVFSFITFGGQLSKDTDMFRSLKYGERKKDFDAFDFYDDTYYVKIEKMPFKLYDYGTDWKETLLKKAMHLNFYKQLIQHDNNYPLPVESNSLGYVYSNSAYWVSKFEEHINDLIRIVRPGGYVILHIKNDQLIKYSSKQYAPYMGEKFHEIIDAGRRSTWKGLRSKDDLIQFFASLQGVKLHCFEPVYGDILTIIWDIGLRPLFNPLARMANMLPNHGRIEVKEEWNQIIFNLFEEYINKYKPSDKNAFEHLVVVIVPSSGVKTMGNT